MNFELFVFDLDGTLLDNNGVISSTTRRVLEKIKGQARVSLATGRSLFSAKPYIEDLKISEPVILYHGAVVFCPVTHQVLREIRLCPQSAQTVLRLAQDFPVDVQLYRSVDDPRVYVRSISPDILKFAEKEGLPIDVVSNYEKLAQKGLLKLLFIGEKEVLAELSMALRDAEVSVVFSEANYLEVLPPGVSKGTSLAWLGFVKGWEFRPLERVVAVGDQESDVPMFERVGLGVAMAHAPSAVRQKAHKTVQDILELHTLMFSWYLD